MFSPLRVEQLEAREVPANLYWVPVNDNETWSNRLNWRVGSNLGAVSTQVPGANDSLHFAQVNLQLGEAWKSSSTADIPKVQAIYALDGTSIHLKNTLEVTNVLDLKWSNVRSTTWSNLTSYHDRQTLNVTGSAIVTITGGTVFSWVDLQLGSPENHSVSSTMGSSGQDEYIYLQNAIIKNYGASTVVARGVKDYGAQSGTPNTSYIANYELGTMEVKSVEGLQYTGQFDNFGKLKINPNNNQNDFKIKAGFDSSNLAQVFPGKVFFTGPIARSHGVFELRGSTVDVTGVTGLYVNSAAGVGLLGIGAPGSLTGSGTVVGDVGLGSDLGDPSNIASISPGMDDGNQATTDIGEIFIFGNLGMGSRSAMRIDVESGTSYDCVLVFGSASVAGSLSVSCSASYSPPQAGTSIKFFLALTLGGDFAETTISRTPFYWTNQDNMAKRHYWKLNKGAEANSQYYELIVMLEQGS